MRQTCLALIVTAGIVTALALPVTPQSPGAPPNDGSRPFTDKVVVFSTPGSVMETHEHVRVKSLEGIAFLVTRPVVVNYDGTTYPKQQTWYRMPDLFYSFDSKAAADSFTAEERDRIARLNPEFHPPELKYFAHPPDANAPFSGKAVVAYSSAGPILGSPGFAVRSLGGEAYFSSPSEHLKDGRIWTNLENIDRIVVFDSLVDAQSHFNAITNQAGSNTQRGSKGITK